VTITDARSHASLACAFLSRYCDDEDLLAMVQYHDEPFALYRQYEAKGKYNQERFNALLRSITDWNLFLAFNIIDGCTEGKSRQPLHWFFREVDGKVESRFTSDDIIPTYHGRGRPRPQVTGTLRTNPPLQPLHYSQCARLGAQHSSSGHPDNRAKSETLTTPMVRGSTSRMNPALPSQH